MVLLGLPLGMILACIFDKLMHDQTPDPITRVRQEWDELMITMGTCIVWIALIA